MKKSLNFLACMVLFFSCQHDQNGLQLNKDQTEGNLFRQQCYTDIRFEQQIQKNPSLRRTIDLIEQKIDLTTTQSGLKMTQTQYTIPIVVNVLYHKESENMTMDQIKDQIEVLNNDFNALNDDFDQVPEYFAALKAKVGIRFVLDKVVRKYSNKVKWPRDDRMKYEYNGGIDPTSPESKLNIWVCKIDGYSGFAQFPGEDVRTDGVVVNSTNFGIHHPVFAKYNKGRTLTHEVGHWLGLRHLWGMWGCESDLVEDTPLQDGPNMGSPIFPHYSECDDESIELTMNYMDYTLGSHRCMFTKGQKKRMLAHLINNGPRSKYLIDSVSPNDSQVEDNQPDITADPVVEDSPVDNQPEEDQNDTSTSGGWLDDFIDGLFGF